ncbi:MAG TPA: SprB repeat-containing protein, partial [Flavobacteriales bacterium]|nr:SprB repeat-containing protein [Flavobacteriales bacterium]
IANSFANTTISHTDALCNGGNSGTASVASAGNGSTYSWNTTPAQTAATATNLGAGNYTVTITDSYNCHTTLSTTVSQPAAITLASLTATNETCAGQGNGGATAVAAGGTAPYSYTWNTGATTASITAGAGNYSVSITDANNCAPATGNIAITAAAQPNQANAGADLVGCVGAFPIVLNGSVVNATGGAWGGGTGSFSGAWPNVSYNPSAADVQNNGVTLTLTSTGNTNCPAASDQVFINIPNSFANASISGTNISCNGGNNGTAIFSPAAPGFTYAWNTTPVQSTSTATGLGAGNYSVLATDAFGCSTTLSTTLTQPTALALLGMNVTNETCAGDANGSITASASGGTGPYTFTWNNGATGAVLTAGAGTYTVTIVDANGCAPINGTATIIANGQPNEANAGPDQIGCIGSFPIGLNGSVVNATGGTWSGGTGSFSGAWPNVSYNPSTADVQNNGVTLTLTSTGNTNCPAASDQVFINIPNSFANLAISSTNATCFGSTTGTCTTWRTLIDGGMVKCNRLRVRRTAVIATLSTLGLWQRIQYLLF